MPYLKVLDVDVHYRDGGAGPAVLLGHSSTGSGGQWRGLFTRLSDRYRLLAPDHLGYGRTGAWPGNEPLIEHELEILTTLADRVGGRVHLVGHSYGGALVARFATRHPSRALSLTLIEPTLFHLLESWGPSEAYREVREIASRVLELAEKGDTEAAARAFIEYWIAPGAFERLGERARASVLAGVAKLRVEFPTAFDARGAAAIDLSPLECPKLLIRGDRTTAASHGVMRALADIWPRARHESIADAGHMAPLTHADRVGALVEEFLDEVSGAPDPPRLG